MNGIPPMAPMPPPPPGLGFHQGGGLPQGVFPVNDMPQQHHHNANDIYDEYMPPFDVFQDDYQEPKGKKKGDKGDKNDKKKTEEKKHERVENKYVGFVLERAEPLLGQKSSWARVGKRPLPFPEDKLVALVKAHRARTGTTQTNDFNLLSSNQQGIINRLIEDHKNNEKNPRADWILVDVQRFGTWHWRSLDVRKIQVVLKRYDREAAKPGDRTSGQMSSYQFGEIIDLAEPVRKPQKETTTKAKKENKDKVLDHDMDFIDEPMVIDVDGRQRPQFQDHPVHHAPMPQHQHQHPHPQQPQQMYDPVGLAQHQQPMPPPGAIPIPIDPHFLPNQQRPMDNPFQPAYDPRQHEIPFENFPERQSARVRMRSPSPSPHHHERRRRSSSRNSRHEKRRLKRLEGKLDEVVDKLDNWHVSSGDNSSEGAFDEDSVFSPPPSGGSFTPPSTPPRSEYGPLGSLHNRGKSPARRGENRSREPRYHRQRAEQVEIEPAYTTASRRPREARYAAGGMPRLQRANTYDDYPVGRTVERRYLPAARPRPTRMLTDYAEGYEEATYDDQFRRRRGGDREDRRRSDADAAIREAFEAGRREAAAVPREAPRYGRREYHR